MLKYISAYDNIGGHTKNDDGKVIIDVIETPEGLSLIEQFQDFGAIFKSSDNAFEYNFYGEKSLFRYSDEFGKRRFYVIYPDDSTLNTYISCNGTLTPALEFVSHSKVIDFFGLKKNEELIGPCFLLMFDNDYENAPEWNSLRIEYEEIAEYRNILVESGGKEYGQVYTDELEEIRNKAMELAQRYANELNIFVNECWFVGDKSLIADLSLVNGNKIFTFYGDFVDTPVGTIIDWLGEFWSYPNKRINS